MYKKLCQMIKRSITTQPQSDKTFNPTVKVSSFSNVTDSEVIFPYGYYSVAPKNSQAITLNILGQENNQSSFVYNNSSRFKDLQVGEVQIGGQQTGNNIKFSNNGDIYISNDNGSISLSSSNLVLKFGTAELTITSTGINSNVPITQP